MDTSCHIPWSMTLVALVFKCRELQHVWGKIESVFMQTGQSLTM